MKSQNQNKKIAIFVIGIMLISILSILVLMQGANAEDDPATEKCYEIGTNKPLFIEISKVPYATKTPRTEIYYIKESSTLTDGLKVPPTYNLGTTKTSRQVNGKQVEFYITSTNGIVTFVSASRIQVSSGDSYVYVKTGDLKEVDPSKCGITAAANPPAAKTETTPTASVVGTKTTQTSSCKNKATTTELFACTELGKDLHDDLVIKANKNKDKTFIVGTYECYWGLCSGDTDACCISTNAPASATTAQAPLVTPPLTPDTTPTPAKALSVSVWTKIKWDFAKLCLGNDKKLSELNNQLDYFQGDKDCLDGLNRYSEIESMDLTTLKKKSQEELTTVVNKNINGGIPDVFIRTISGKRFVDGSKIKDCISRVSDLKNYLPDGDKLVTDKSTIKKLNEDLIGPDKPLTKKLVDIIDEQQKLTENTRRTSGWNSVERYVSIISCAYGVAGGIILAKDSGSCEAEVPLSGTTYCGQCGDAFMPCTAERCGILGNCRAIAREDGKGYMCLPGVCEGESSQIPNINYADLLWYKGRIIQVDDDLNVGIPFIKTSQVNYTTNTLNLTVTLSSTDGGKCGYSFENGTAFASMTYFENAWKYPQTQSALIDLSGLALGRTHTIFIKCESRCGSVNEPSDDSQYIRFTFEKRPDALPPEIVRVVPDPQTQYLNNASHYARIEVWLNENGYCKYSTINDSVRIGGNLSTRWNTTAATINNTEMSPYTNAMHNVIAQGTICVPNQPCGYTNELGTFSLYRAGTANNCTICYLNISQDRGYEEIDWDAIAAQSAVQSQEDQNLRDLLDQRGLTALGLTGKSKMFHYEFRCADFGRNGAPGADDNIMPEEETYDYIIFTYPPFNMTIVEPVNNSALYLPIPLRVETSRETQCKYIACGPNIGGLVRPCNNTWENMLYIDGDIYDVIHEKELENLTYGWNTIHVRCRDRGNLEVADMVRINVLQDSVSPMIIRMAHGVNDNALFIETNEKADCVVSLDKLKACSYNFSQGTTFMTTDGYVQSYTWTPSSLHYIKCKDRWNNYPGSRSDANNCTAVIDPIEIPEI